MFPFSYCETLVEVVKDVFMMCLFAPTITKKSIGEI